MEKQKPKKIRFSPDNKLRVGGIIIIFNKKNLNTSFRYMDNNILFSNVKNLLTNVTHIYIYISRMRIIPIGLGTGPMVFVQINIFRIEAISKFPKYCDSRKFI